MSNGAGDPLSQAMGGGMAQAAQQGQTQTPQAGGSPLAVPQASTYGVGTSTAPMPGAMPNVTGTTGENQTNSVGPAQQGNNPYSSFLTALQQIQSASPVQSVGDVTPNARPSQAGQKATMRETGVG